MISLYLSVFGVPARDTDRHKMQRESCSIPFFCDEAFDGFAEDAAFIDSKKQKIRSQDYI
jgi:hypothetical protein